MAEDIVFITVPLERVFDREYIAKAAQAERHRIEVERVKSLFRDRDHARAVWDAWDGCEGGPGSGEDAHFYLNLIGDGRYCAV